MDELEGKVNYFIGDDPGQWRADIPTYARVQYENVYEGVGLIYYGNRRRLASNQQQFADDFVGRTEFTAVYAGLTDEQYVDALNAGRSRRRSATRWSRV